MSPRKPAASRSKKDQNRSKCPIACTLDLVGDKWTMLVVRDLSLGCKRYGDFLASPEGYPTNILADRLKRLEAAEMIERVLYSKRPPRAEYYLTDRGRSLTPLMDALSTWGLAHIPGTVPWVRPTEAEAAEPENKAPLAVEPTPLSVRDDETAVPVVPEVEPLPVLSPISEEREDLEMEPPVPILCEEAPTDQYEELADAAPAAPPADPGFATTPSSPSHHGGNGHHAEEPESELDVEADGATPDSDGGDGESQPDPAPVDRLRANPDERQDQMSLW